MVFTLEENSEQQTQVTIKRGNKGEILGFIYPDEVQYKVADYWEVFIEEPDLRGSSIRILRNVEEKILKDLVFQYRKPIRFIKVKTQSNTGYHRWVGVIPSFPVVITRHQSYSSLPSNLRPMVDSVSQEEMMLINRDTVMERFTYSPGFVDENTVKIQGQFAPGQINKVSVNTEGYDLPPYRGWKEVCGVTIDGDFEFLCLHPRGLGRILIVIAKHHTELQYQHQYASLEEGEAVLINIRQ